MDQSLRKQLRSYVANKIGLKKDQNLHKRDWILFTEDCYKYASKDETCYNEPAEPKLNIFIKYLEEFHRSSNFSKRENQFRCFAPPAKVRGRRKAK